MVPDSASLGSIADYEQAITADPRELSNYWQLGLLYWLADDLEGAQAVWLSGLMTAASDDAALEDLLSLLQTEADRQLATRPDQAEQLYHLMLEMQSDPEAAVFASVGQAAAQQGRLEEAMDWWQQAIDQNPTWADPYRWQGRVWLRLEQYDAAATAYQQATELQPEAQTWADLGLCLIHLQRWQSAIEALQAAMQMQPDSNAAIDLGWVWFCLQQLDQAWRYFRSGLQQSQFAQTYCNWVDEQAQNIVTLTPALSQNAALLRGLIGSEAAELPIQQLQALVAQRFRPVQSPDAEASSPSQTPCFETTQTWATDAAQTNATQTNATQWIELDPAQDLILTPPHTLDADLHFSFCFERRMQLPGTFVAQIPQGRVWLAADQSSTAVWTAENQLLGDLSFEFPLLSPGHPDRHPSRHSAQSRSLPPVQPVAGRVAVLAGLTDAMYFHWMFDVLPRLDLLQRSGEWTSIDWFLVSNQQPFQRQTLAMLGVPADRILAVVGEVHLQAEQLIVPSFPAVPAWMPDWACEFLRRTILPDSAASNLTSSHRSRLYLSRQQTVHRRIINQNDIQPVLDQFGFQTVYLESLTVSEQAILLAQAEAVVSPHGSGLTNLVFCQPGTKVIELFSPNFVYPCYWLVSNQVGLAYYYLTGTTPAGHFLQRVLYPNPRLEDLWIDPVQLTTLLQRAFSDAA